MGPSYSRSQGSRGFGHLPALATASSDQRWARDPDLVNAGHTSCRWKTAPATARGATLQAASQRLVISSSKTFCDTTPTNRWPHRNRMRHRLFSAEGKALYKQATEADGGAGHR